MGATDMIKIVTFVDIGNGHVYEARRIPWPPDKPASWTIVKLHLYNQPGPETLSGEVLFQGLTLDNATAKLVEIAKELALICEGCDSHYDKCGPALWVQQKKCCPDCTHEEPLIPCEACNGGADLVGDDGPCQCGRTGYMVAR